MHLHVTRRTALGGMPFWHRGGTARGLRRSIGTAHRAQFDDECVRPAESRRYAAVWPGQLIAAAAIEPDRDKRKAMYARLNDIFVDQAFVMALAVQTICMVTTARVQGIAPLWHEAFSFKEAWLSA